MLMPLRMVRALPRVARWIRQMLADHAADAVPVTRFGHRHLRQYYPERFLARTKVVVTDQMPSPPLHAWGFGDLGFLPGEQTAGITFLDTFFVRRSCVDNEALFFHELVHVIQWRRLGLTRFLLLYAMGLVAHGYRDSPLEAAAYQIGAKFRPGSLPFDAYEAALQETNWAIDAFKRDGFARRLAWLASGLGPRR